MQVSLRDPLRRGADENELKEIIGAAVCIFQSCIALYIAGHQMFESSRYHSCIENI